MQRLNLIEPASAPDRSRELLGAVQRAFGMTPNATRVMANSPAVLDSFLAFSTAMGQAGIGEKLLNQVKLAASETNACDYCASILTAIAPQAGLSAEDVLTSRQVTSHDPRTDAALKFARAVLDTRGKVTDAQLAGARQAGLSDSDIVEIIAGVVLACFTNFLNNVADTTLDIPRAAPIEPCVSGVCSL
jgi:uncharacterized peroxidase-related enzyme